MLTIQPSAGRYSTGSIPRHSKATMDLNFSESSIVYEATKKKLSINKSSTYLFREVKCRLKQNRQTQIKPPINFGISVYLTLTYFDKTQANPWKMFDCVVPSQSK